MRVKTLPLASLTTGILLVSSMGALYDVAEQLNGWRPFTHQLGEVIEHVRREVLKQHPTFPTYETHARYFREDPGVTYGVYTSGLLREWGDEVELDPIAQMAQPDIFLEERLVVVRR